MSYKPDELRIEMYLDGAWTDVSADVIPPIVGTEGISGRGPLDRVADAGRMTFILDNGETNSAKLPGYYTPGHANVRTGFDTGVKVRLYINWEGLERYRFYGQISQDGLRPAPGRFDSRYTFVTVVDWFEQAEKHNLTLPTFRQNKTASEVVEFIVAKMPIAPLETDYQECADTFLFVFDTVRNNTTAIGEMMKSIFSEWGYSYIKHNNTTGEVLTVEGRGNRDPLTIDSIVVAADMAGLLRLEASIGTLLLETGGDFVLNQLENASFDNQYVQQSALAYGSEIYNRVSGKTYPREIDAAATTVLFSLQSPFAIGKGITKRYVRGRYRDPDGGNWMAGGTEMEAPVSGVDYIANYASDGGGADATSDMNLTATFGTEAVRYRIENTNTSQDIWITTLQAVGKGVYIYDPIESVRTDSDSQALYGEVPITLDMKYQDNETLSEGVAESVLYYYKDPHAIAQPPWFNCSVYGKAMAAFMGTDVGDTIEFKDEQTAIDGNFYVQGHSFRIERGNVIYYSPNIVSVDFALTWILGVQGFSEVGKSTYLVEA